MKKSIFKIIAIAIIANFIFTSVPVRGYASFGSADKLRTQPAVKRDGGGEIKVNLLIEGYKNKMVELRLNGMLKLKVDQILEFGTVYKNGSEPLIDLINKLTPQNISEDYLLKIISTATEIINSNARSSKYNKTEDLAALPSQEALLVDLGNNVIKETRDFINELKQLRLADGGKTITVEKDNIFGPQVEVTLINNKGIWMPTKLTVGGEAKEGGTRELGVGDLKLADFFIDQKAIEEFYAARAKYNEDGKKTVAYWMYRNLNPEVAKKYKIRADITVIPPLIIGNQPIFTTGHYHPGNYTEVYVVLSGRATYYLQKVDSFGNVVDAVQIDAKKGDVVVIPPGYGHITVNPSEDEALVMMNWVSDEFKSEYGKIIEFKGGAYKFIIGEDGDIKAVKNENYENGGVTVVDLRRGAVSDELAKAIGLPKGEPVYDVINRPRDLVKLVTFLSQPTPAFTLQFLANDLRRIVTAFYNSADGREFEDFLESVKDANLALLFGANAIFENAGTIALLNKIKEISPGVKIVVWAKDESEIERLRAIGLENVADIVSIGFQPAFAEIENTYHFSGKDIAVIKSVNDSMDVKDDIGGLQPLDKIVSQLGLNKIILLPELNTKEQDIAHAMELVITRLFSDIINDDYVLNKYEILSNSYVKRGQILEENLNSFNRYTEKLLVAPLIQVTHETAQLQREYEQLQIQIKETVGEI